MFFSFIRTKSNSITIFIYKIIIKFLITDDFDRDDEDEDEDEDKIQTSYSVGFYKSGFVSYSASKGTGLETIVQELADFCDDRDETRFGKDYYVLGMQ